MERYHVTSVQSSRSRRAGRWLLSSGFGVKKRKGSVFRFAGKRTYLPILELLPPSALRERRHRGLARHCVAVRRDAVLMLAKGFGPLDVMARRGVVLRARRGHRLFRLRVKLIGIGLH